MKSKLLKLTMLISIVLVLFTAPEICRADTYGDYAYSVSNGAANITDYTGNDSSIELPAEINGYPVTSIGSYAFYDCTSLASITIPDSVTCIGDYAFYGCASLTSITIPDSVTSIGYDAFSSCSNLKNVYITDIETWCNIDFESYASNPMCNDADLYVNKVKVTDLVIPDGTMEIKQYAFRGCSSLTSITIPDSVTSIGSSAFSGCSNLKNVHISDISAWCKIDFASYNSNPMYKGADLYVNNVKVTDPVIPAGTKEIKRYVFSGFTSLTSITIPNSVTSIGYGAFNGCSSLEEMTIPFVGSSRDADRTFGYIFGSSSYTGSYSATQYYSSGSNSYSRYYIPSSLKKVTITDDATISYGAFYGCTSLASITIPDSVTSIGSSAFSGCSSLASITIPDSVTSIGDSAFSGCSSLEEMIIPFVGSSRDAEVTSDAVFGYIFGRSSYTGSYSAEQHYSTSSYSYTTYYIPSSLKKVTITDDATIPYGAFYNCTSLTYITMPDSVTSIETQAFSNCRSLASITIPDSVTNIGSSAFNGCTSLASITIPDSVTSIGSSAFSGCASFTSIFIPNSVTSIGSSAFNGCRSLKNVYISDIGAWCNIDFASNDSNPMYNGADLYVNKVKVTDLVIPDGTMEIKQYAFYGCTFLTSITIPDSVTSIGSSAFSSCSSLEEMTIPFVGSSRDADGTSDAVFGYIFGSIPSSLKKVTITDDATIPYGAFNGCTSLASITIPDSVTSIGHGAFSGCSSLASITIPDSVTRIGDSAFSGCSSLTSITIPNSVTSIGDYAFSGCTSLTSITIPNSVTRIGDSAFSGCSSLASITIPDSVTSIGDSAFSGCTSLEEMTIPFVGSSRDADGTSDAVFGYIFGSSSYTGSYSAKQYYSTGANSYSTYYIPSSLKKVTVTDDATIPYGAFYNCTSITDIIISDTTTSIGSSTFSGCSSLEEMTIPFIGAKRGISGTCDSVFGYIFGTSGDTVVIQQYGTSSDRYAISTSLRKVTVTDETTIPYGAFSNCSFLTDIVIEGNPTTIMADSFSGFYNLFNVTIKSRDVKYTNSNIFKDSEFPTLYGYIGSTTEDYAEKYEIEFVSLDGDSGSSSYQLSGKAKVVEGKIVINASSSKEISDKNLHIALYNNSSELIDYIIVPSYDVFKEMNVVFKDNSKAEYAKIFLWESLTSLTPVAKAVRVDITRE